jgi:uncharacterized protein with PQ loop repeat
MEVINEYIGWIGSVFFAICALPQVIKTYKTKRVDDISALFLWLWFLGEVFTLWYIVYDDIITGTTHWPLIFNYLFNIFMLFYLIWAKYSYPGKYNGKTETV